LLRYFAAGGVPKAGELPRKILELSGLDLRADPQQVRSERAPESRWRDSS
jgi:hypothetical protein